MILFSTTRDENWILLRWKTRMKKVKSLTLPYGRATASRSKSVSRLSGSSRFQQQHQFLQTFRGSGVNCPEPAGPTTPDADVFCPWNCEKIQNRPRWGGRGFRRASRGKDLLGRWLARRLALPIFSRLPSREGIFKGIGIKMWMAGLVVITAVATCQAEDWLQWRGPHRDGVLTAFTEPKVWPEVLKLKWKIPVGTGHSSPVVAAGRVYLHTRQEEREVVSCYDLETGKPVWQETYVVPYTMNPAAVQHGKGPKSTPVISDGKLYTLGISGILSCFEIKTGKLCWRKEFSKEFKETSPLYGTSMSPVVEAGRLIAHVGGHDQGALTAFNAETGEVRWSWKGDGPGHSSPIIVDLSGTRQAVTLTQSFLVSVDVTDGKLLWSRPFKTEYDQNIVTPLLYGQMLIYSGVFQPTTAIRINRNGNTWSTEKVWENPEVSMYMNSPVVSGDLLFGFSHRNKGQFFCLDGRTGATLWTSQGRQGENAAILIAGGVLFLLTNDAELIVARKDGRKFEPIRRYSVAQSPTWAHPIILGRQILIKDTSSLALWSLD